MPVAHYFGFLTVGLVLAITPILTQLRIKIPISNERKTVFSILLIIAGVVLLNLSGSAHAQEQPKTYQSGH
ncbi:hypothetical protein J28TS4_37760 [Paenibacillus lautus]|nr:hypothetical protein J28TS4_37760 [Paenibacillus lautus]